MIDAFAGGEGAQLGGCGEFICANDELRIAYTRFEWRKVAFFYNGSAFAKHGYDKKLEATFKGFAKGPDLPSIAIRQIQAYLTYLCYNPRGIDGVVGPGTLSALRLFQKDRERAGVPLTEFDPAQPGLYLSRLCDGCGHIYDQRGGVITSKL